MDIQSPSGLSVQVNANGSIRRMDCGDILLNLFLGTEMEGGPANLYLRRHGAAVEAMPLLGPRSPAAFQVDQRANGRRRGMAGDPLPPSAGAGGIGPGLVLARVAEEHSAVQRRPVDLIYAQDLALAHYGAVRLNEYYMSHYVDHTPLTHPERGVVLCSRQNLSMGGRNPWTVIGTLGSGVSYATDALQVHGLATRAGRLPVGVARGLPGARRQHEHSMVAIQDASVRLEPGGSHRARLLRLVRSRSSCGNLRGRSCFCRQGPGPAGSRACRESRSGLARLRNRAASLFSTAPLLDSPGS